ncbi:MAG: ZIP family metal transporter [Treponema sp.]|nr:ZIP family metal transporter [Treponema sp.]
MHSFLLAGGGLGFIFMMSCLGAATVFFFRKSVPAKIQRLFLGFAAGVMIAASVWGLLVPAVETAGGWIPVAAGFAFGVLFLLGLDHVIPHLHPFSGVAEGPASRSKGTTLLVSAVTLHNIPEGMAVGLALALASQAGTGPEAYAGAAALALGIGIQNLPESAAVSLALRQEGAPPFKAFALAALSGAVEPAFGVLTVLLAVQVAPVMPWLLAFAAGAMMFVVVEELIPEANPETGKAEHSNLGTIGTMAGFLLMMVLDMALG